MTTNYYRKNKEELQKEALERYQSLFQEEKDKNHQYAREGYRNLSEEEKKRSVNMGVNDIKIF